MFKNIFNNFVCWIKTVRWSINLNTNENGLFSFYFNFPHRAGTCIRGNSLYLWQWSFFFFFLIRRVLSPFFSSSLFRLHCLTVCVPLCFNGSLPCSVTLSFESSVHYFGRFFSAILFINQENILFLKWGRISCNVTRKKEKSIRSLLTKLSALPMITHDFGR